MSAFVVYLLGIAQTCLVHTFPTQFVCVCYDHTMLEVCSCYAHAMLRQVLGLGLAVYIELPIRGFKIKLELI